MAGTHPSDGVGLLRNRFGDRLRPDVPLGPFTTFKVGGPAEWFIDLLSVDELRMLLAVAADAGIPVTVLGGGSNVLISDAGLRGVVVRLRLSGIEQPREDLVRAEAGVSLNGLVRWLIGRGLAGLEEWAGTPGTVGGALYGNAHWRGRDIGDFVHRVLLVNRSGAVVDVSRAEMGFAYDTSRLQRTAEIAVWAEFGVTPGVPEVLRHRARAALAYRKGTQPLAMASAGCVFQNPEPSRDALPDAVPASAGALVDRAGFKGFRIGGAMVSPTHANFVVNDGTATACDIRAVIDAARSAVRDRFGILLRDEIVHLGTF